MSALISANGGGAVNTREPDQLLFAIVERRQPF